MHKDEQDGGQFRDPQEHKDYLRGSRDGWKGEKDRDYKKTAKYPVAYEQGFVDGAEQNSELDNTIDDALRPPAP